MRSELAGPVRFSGGLPGGGGGETARLRRLRACKKTPAFVNQNKARAASAAQRRVHSASCCGSRVRLCVMGTGLQDVTVASVVRTSSVSHVVSVRDCHIEENGFRVHNAPGMGASIREGQSLASHCARANGKTARRCSELTSLIVDLETKNSLIPRVFTNVFVRYSQRHRPG